MRETVTAPAESAEASALAELLGSTATPWGSTRWATFQQCEHKYDQRYRLHLVPQQRAIDTPQPLQIGSLVHAGIAAQESEAAAWEDLVHYASTEQPDRWDPSALAEARRLLAAYYGHWGYKSWCKVIAVERGYQRDVGRLPYSGRPDLEIEADAGGALGLGLRPVEPGTQWFVDHKTQRGLADYTSDDEIREEWLPRPQFRGVAWLIAQQHGLDYYPGCVVNIIVKTKTPKFRRVDLAFTERQVLQWHDVQERIALRAALMVPGHAIPNYHECIDRYGKQCWAFGNCHREEQET